MNPALLGIPTQFHFAVYENFEFGVELSLS